MEEKIIDSYYASYPLEYYEVGKVYSFYANRGKCFAPEADTELVKEYSRKFEHLSDDLDVYSLPGQFSRLIRFYGVVINKEKGDGRGNCDKITVLLHQKSDGHIPEFGIKKYAVNTQGIWADGMEVLPAKAMVESNVFAFGNYENVIGNSMLQNGKGPSHQPVELVADGPAHQPITAINESGEEENPDNKDGVTGVVTLADDIVGVVTLAE